MKIESMKMARSDFLPLAVKFSVTDLQMSCGIRFHEFAGSSLGHWGVANAIDSVIAMHRPSASAQFIRSGVRWLQTGFGKLMRLQMNRKVLILRLPESMIDPLASKVGV